MYKDLIQTHKNNVSGYNGISASKITDFEKEADEIYKLDTSKRDNPLIKGYMTERYQIKPEKVNAIEHKEAENNILPRQNNTLLKRLNMLKVLII